MKWSPCNGLTFTIYEYVRYSRGLRPLIPCSVCRDGDWPDAVLGPTGLQIPRVHYEQQQGRAAQGQQGLGGKLA